MPAATTHTEFARKVYNSLPFSIQQEITDPHAYFLGSQGPDYMFFSRAYVLPGSLSKYGNMMHHTKVREAILYLHTHCASSGVLKSYFYGFMTHYALDSKMHPHINREAKKIHDTVGTFEGEAHFRIEAELDAWVLQKEKKSYRVFKDVKVSDSAAEVIGTLYEGLFHTVYGMEIPAKRFEDSCHDVSTFTKMIAPGSSAKYHTVIRLETLAKQPHMISAMMLDEKDPSVLPLLNPNHEAREIPGQPGVTDSRDLPEQLEDAKQLALKLITKFDPEDLNYDFIGEPAD